MTVSGWLLVLLSAGLQVAGTLLKRGRDRATARARSIARELRDDPGTP